MENRTLRILGALLVVLPISIMVSVFTGGDYLELDSNAAKVASGLSEINENRGLVMVSMGSNLFTNLIGTVATGLLYIAFAPRSRPVATVAAISMALGTAVFFVHAGLQTGLLTLAAAAADGDATSASAAHLLAQQLNVLDAIAGSMLVLGVGLVGALVALAPRVAGEAGFLAIPRWSGWVGLAAPVIGLPMVWLGLEMPWASGVAILAYNAMMLFFLAAGIGLLRRPGGAPGTQPTRIASHA